MAAGGSYSIENIAAIACGALNTYEQFTAETPAARQKVQPKPKSKPGTVVEGTAVVNGKAVPVEGKVVR